MAPRPVAVRRPEISGKVSSNSTTSTPTRRKAARRGEIAIGTFDNFNIVVAGVKGTLAAGVELIYDTLLTSSLDEVSTGYGLLAEAVSYPDDFSSASYRLRAEAKWHDGKPVTPEDVIFSFDGVQEKQPAARRLLPPCRQGRKNRRSRGHLHLRRPGQPRTAADRRRAHGPAQALVGGHRQERQEARHRRQPRSSRRSAAAPIASRISRPAAPSSTSASRIIGARTSTSISAATISTSCASNISATRTVALEAFKADTVDWRTENSAKNWATAYDFPAVTDKRVLLEEFPINTPA